MRKIVFNTDDDMHNAATISFYGAGHRLVSLFYAPDGYTDFKDFEKTHVESKAFVVREGFEEAKDFDNLSEAIEAFEALTGQKLKETSVLAAFKAYVVAEIFFVF